ncbi:MAG: DNA polymerase III subunit delta [Prevotellaceae bacterium]|jgi:DNA polymerase-3 subunit delta|nr:DNA polymerase III subunit delta [Prevotellaceae bacterium]
MAKKETTYDEIMSELRNRHYSPIYFLMGEEPYYIDKISDYILETVLTADEREFNQTVLYGKDVDIRTVINTAKRFPMMAERQVVVVKEAQNIKNFEDLQFYAQKPLASTVLVFCYKYGKPDMRRKFISEVAKVGTMFESKKLYDNQIPTFISSYLRNKGVSIEPKATMMIAEFLGADLGRVVGELDKLLITKSADEKVITPDLVEKNIGISKDFNNFELQAALINRNVLKANQIAHYFEQNPKDNPLVVTLTVLFNFFSGLFLLYYLPVKSPSAIAAELKINPYFTKDYELALRNYPAKKVMDIIALIRTCDARGKGFGNPSASNGELLKELIYKILH